MKGSNSNNLNSLVKAYQAKHKAATETKEAEEVTETVSEDAPTEATAENVPAEAAAPQEKNEDNNDNSNTESDAVDTEEQKAS